MWYIEIFDVNSTEFFYLLLLKHLVNLTKWLVDLTKLLVDSPMCEFQSTKRFVVKITKLFS